MTGCDHYGEVIAFIERKGLTMSNGDRNELYENGKHRRYSLLFAANGGTLAIAQYLAGDLKSDAAKTMVGSLTIQRLSMGMVVFSLVMVWDIYAFGSRMHRTNAELFRLPGRVVLCIIGLLICLGWLIAGSYIASDASPFALWHGAALMLGLIILTWLAHEIPEYREGGFYGIFKSLSGLRSNPEDLRQCDHGRPDPRRAPPWHGGSPPDDADLSAGSSGT